ncbi:MAG: sigma-70 family RNA polymerase sigma factor [Actinobacteria bacterium]|nr:sigma-70 family RNA polymerase sigma factor [Actinomycetota bacterium]MBI3687466.1 sigma-70 family RNA polymerase sigma factor [Actinomycetota bacterium]
MVATQPGTTVSWAGLTAEGRSELVRFAQARLGRTRLPGIDAEDVVQEVLLRMIDRGAIQSTRTGPASARRGPQGAATLIEHPAAYLRRAVANECVSRWRRLHRETLTGELPEQWTDDHAELRASWLAVSAALGRLTPRQQQILARGFLLDHSDDQIATDLQISPVTVRTMRRRALAQLRVLMELPPRPPRQEALRATA